MLDEKKRDMNLMIKQFHREHNKFDEEDLRDIQSNMQRKMLTRTLQNKALTNMKLKLR